jgi:hypothetical protein
MARIFMISPLWKVSESLRDKIGECVARLESMGHVVFWPLRDGLKEDVSGGIARALVDREEMCRADEIHVWYDNMSSGSCFDVGMAWAMKYKSEVRKEDPRKIVLVNREAFIDGLDTHFRHFVARLTETDPQTVRHVPNSISDDLEQVFRFPGFVLANQLVVLHFDQQESTHLMRLGIIFALMKEHPIELRAGLPMVAKRTLKCRFDNVFLDLLDHTKNATRTYP